MTTYVKKQENKTHIQRGKKQATQIAWKSAHLLDLSDEHFKIVVINTFKELRETIIKEVKKI